MIDPRALATEWIAAWNSGDLERVLALYDDDFEMRSPLIVERGFAPNGVLRGKAAIRPYWSHGIATATPPLRFELIDVYAGVNTVAIHYRSVGRKIVVEVLELAGGQGTTQGTNQGTRKIIRGSACHGADA